MLFENKSQIFGKITEIWAFKLHHTKIMKTQPRQHISNKYNTCTVVASPVYIGSKIVMSRWKMCRPRWLSWMRHPTGDQEVTGSTPAEVGNILSWRLIMKYFLRSFSPFRWFKKGSCQFLAKECAQYWLTA